MNALATNNEEIPDDLLRVLGLPKRPPVDCERYRGPNGERVWAPQAQALIEVVTEKFTRGPRLSCGCQDRVVLGGSNGKLTVFHTAKPGHTPPLPLQTSIEPFCQDNAHNAEVVKLIGNIRNGEKIELEGVGRPCITTLNPVQAWILRELPLTGGILGFISPGAGKTLAAVLAPLTMPSCRTVVLLAKPDQRLHYRKHYLHAREHFKVSSIIFDKADLGGSYIVPGTPALHYVSYSLLQQKHATDLLDRLNPDMIICDEAHCIAAAPSCKRIGSARANRFIKYMVKRGNVHCCAWSGTLINKKLADVTHLSTHTLGMGSPYPVIPDKIEAWSAVIDPSPIADRSSSTFETLRSAFGRDYGNIKVFDDGSDIREGLKARVIATPGIVTTKSASVAASLYFHKREAPPVPEHIRSALDRVRKDGIRPDDYLMPEFFEQLECASNVGSGFYFHFVYPKGTPKELIDEWFLRRKRYNRELRQKLLMGESHLDTPSLCENAAERAWRDPPYDGPLPLWPAEAWPEWAEIKDKLKPVSRAVWLDDYLAADAAKWAKEQIGIIWYQSVPFGQKVAQLAGIPFHGGGKDAEAAILAEKGDRSIVASFSSHAEGRDGLQFRFNKQLILENMASGKAWNQLLARLVREGQPEDEVHTWVYTHMTENRDAFKKAILLAEFDEEMTPDKQLILSADFTFTV